MSKATLDQALFEAPADYREVKDASQLYTAGNNSGISYTWLSSNSPASAVTSSSSHGVRDFDLRLVVTRARPGVAEKARHSPHWGRDKDRERW